METMRPSGPVKLESIESGLYKEVGVTVTLINNKMLSKQSAQQLFDGLHFNWPIKLLSTMGGGVVSCCQGLVVLARYM